MRLPELFGAVALLALGGCVAMGSSGRNGGSAGQDWLSFGAALAGASPLEFEAMRAAALEDHASRPTADSAIRLAIVAASPANDAPDLALAARLLDEVSVANDRDEDDARFVAFFRPWVLSRREQQAVIDAALAESQSLRQQLDALRALEEQLDADD